MARFILAAFLLIAQALAVAPKTRNQVTLTVGLYDYAGLGRSGENVLTSYIGHELEQAGITPQWAIYERGADGKIVGPAGAPAPLSLFVMPGNAKGAALPLAADTGGYSVPGSDRATILAGDLSREARESRLLPAQVMALAALHELGHALGLHHSHKGIMEPHWSPDSFAMLRAAEPWTPAQRKALLAAAQHLASASIHQGSPRAR